MKNHSLGRMIFLLLLVATAISWLDVFPNEQDELTGLASGSVTFCINRRPQINQSCATSTTADEEFSCLKINGSSKSQDQNVTFLDNISFFNISTFGTQSTNTTGNITFTPSEDDVGTHDIKLFVQDNTSCANNETSLAFTLTIATACSNSFPQINVSCNTTVSVGNLFECIINGSAKDDDQNVTFADNTTLFNVTTFPTLTSNTTGNITFNASDEQTGLHQINLSIADNSTCKVGAFVLHNISVVRICGDNVCQNNESSANCSADCGAATTTTTTTTEEEEEDNRGGVRTPAPKKPSPPPVEKEEKEEEDREPDKPSGLSRAGQVAADQAKEIIGSLIGKGFDAFTEMFGVIKENALTRALILSIITISIVGFWYGAHARKIGKLKSRKRKKISKNGKKT
tara:strand:- start:1834 stop:3036 length:1203 start_codon:yes stop_codon:yes gene_type:complete